MTKKRMYEGGCLCGAVHYRATEDPLWVMHCHCGMCRKMSGAAFFTSVGFAPETFAWTKGAPTLYRSSAKATRGFCSRCGSVLTWEKPGVFSVSLGSLDRPEVMRPQSHNWVTTRLPWPPLHDGLAQYPEINTIGLPTIPRRFSPENDLRQLVRPTIAVRGAQFITAIGGLRCVSPMNGTTIPGIGVGRTATRIGSLLTMV